MVRNEEVNTERLNEMKQDVMNTMAKENWNLWTVEIRKLMAELIN